MNARLHWRLMDFCKALHVKAFFFFLDMGLFLFVCMLCLSLYKEFEGTE